MNVLTEQQLAELDNDLRVLLEQLTDQLDNTEDQTKPVVLDQQAMGRVSRIDAIQQQQMAKANRQQSQVLLNRVMRALESINNNEYGFCKQCDEPIGFARLKARPDTPLCIKCQAANE